MQVEGDTHDCICIILQEMDDFCTSSFNFSFCDRLATVASGAASGKLLQYEVGGPRVSVQTAYGVEVEVVF